MGVEGCVRLLCNAGYDRKVKAAQKWKVTNLKLAVCVLYPNHQNNTPSRRHISFAAERTDRDSSSNSSGRRGTRGQVVVFSVNAHRVAAARNLHTLVGSMHMVGSTKV